MDAAFVCKVIKGRHDPREWVFLTEVRTATGWGGKKDSEVSIRYIDAFAISLWPSKGFQRIAYEVKVSRSDLLSELRNPAKRFQARVLAHEFWYVVAPGVYNPAEDRSELDGCGVIEVLPTGQSRIVERVRNHGWVPMPMPETFVASLLRRAADESLHQAPAWEVAQEALALYKERLFEGEDFHGIMGACARYEGFMDKCKQSDSVYPVADLTFVVGDATQPLQRPALIIHACNDRGVWGHSHKAGFVGALSRRWSGPEAAYQASGKVLGTCSAAKVEEGLFVVNMVCQAGVDEDRCISPLALENCLDVVSEMLDKWPGEKPTVHLPRIGAGLGRTPWHGIETALRYGLPGAKLFVYDLPRA
jgi:O-acetyl-ADP-ribose deacetylase (regulator of RNase III)